MSLALLCLLDFLAGGLHTILALCESLGDYSIQGGIERCASGRGNAGFRAKLRREDAENVVLKGLAFYVEYNRLCYSIVRFRLSIALWYWTRIPRFLLTGRGAASKRQLTLPHDFLRRHYFNTTRGACTERGYIQSSTFCTKIQWSSSLEITHCMRCAWLVGVQ